MNLFTLGLISILYLSFTAIAANPTRQLKSFVWRDRVIANYPQLAEVVRRIDSIDDADNLIEVAWRRGNTTSTLGLVLDELSPDEQDQFVATFRIDHPVLGNHAYARRVSPAYRTQLARLVEMGLPAEQVETVVGAVPDIYGFGLTRLREQMSAFRGTHVDIFQALHWVIEAESKCEGRRGLGAAYRQVRFLANFVHSSERLDQLDKAIRSHTKSRTPIDALLKRRAQIVRRLARYGSDPKTIEKTRRRGIELEIANLEALQFAADEAVERARTRFELDKAVKNNRLRVRIGFVAPELVAFDPESARDQTAELARAERLLILRAELEPTCVNTLQGNAAPPEDKII